MKNLKYDIFHYYWFKLLKLGEFNKKGTENFPCLEFILKGLTIKVALI